MNWTKSNQKDYGNYLIDYRWKNAQEFCYENELL